MGKRTNRAPQSLSKVAAAAKPLTPFGGRDFYSAVESREAVNNGVSAQWRAGSQEEEHIGSLHPRVCNCHVNPCLLVSECMPPCECRHVNATM